MSRLTDYCKKMENHIEDIETIYFLNGFFTINDKVFSGFDSKNIDEDIEIFNDLSHKWYRYRKAQKEKEKDEAISKMSDRELLEAIYRKLV